MDIFSTDNKPNRGRVAIVSSKESFSVLGIKKKLQESGIEGIPVKPSVFQIEESVDAGDPIIYYLDDDIYTPRGEDFLNELKRLCLEEDRLVILVGAKADYEKAIETIPKSAIVEWFARPVDMDALITTVESAINGEISPSRRQHILIVDDDVTYMRMMHEWMKERYQVTMLDAGSAAIHWLMDGNMVDLILLDYEMPAMDGPKVWKMIKGAPATRDIPVMFLTGKNSRELVLNAIDLRPVDYILKSIDKRSLMDKLESYFARKKSYENGLNQAGSETNPDSIESEGLQSQ